MWMRSRLLGFGVREAHQVVGGICVARGRLLLNLVLIPQRPTSTDPACVASGVARRGKWQMARLRNEWCFWEMLASRCGYRDN